MVLTSFLYVNPAQSQNEKQSFDTLFFNEKYYCRVLKDVL